MLKQRLITALILIPVFVWASLAWPTGLLAALLGLVVLLGVWEWSRLFGWADLQRAAYLLLFTLLLYGGYQIAMSRQGLMLVLVVGAVWWAVASAWVFRVQRRSGGGSAAAPRGGFESLRGAVLGALVLLPCYVAVLALHAAEAFGAPYMLFCLTLMWAADTAAYFAGRRWGRRKLADKVSPGKSWEGVAGALAVCALWAALGGWLLGLDLAAVPLFIGLSLLAVAFSVVGDLFESMFKRRAQVKDSGHILPGHGGILDRIDSVTAGAPVFALGLFAAELGRVA